MTELRSPEQLLDQLRRELDAKLEEREQLERRAVEVRQECEQYFERLDAAYRALGAHHQERMASARLRLSGHLSGGDRS